MVFVKEHAFNNGVYRGFHVQYNMKLIAMVYDHNMQDTAQQIPTYLIVGNNNDEITLLPGKIVTRNELYIYVADHDYNAFENWLKTTDKSWTRVPKRVPFATGYAGDQSRSRTPSPPPRQRWSLLRPFG